MKKLLTGLIAIVATVLSSGTANATESPAPTVISNIWVSDAGNYHFRVTGSYTGSTWFCNNASSSGPGAWAYLEENDSGAKGKMAMLMTAFMAGKTVYFKTEGRDTPAGHLCHIVEFQVMNY